MVTDSSHQYSPTGVAGECAGSAIGTNAPEVHPGDRISLSVLTLQLLQGWTKTLLIGRRICNMLPDGPEILQHCDQHLVHRLDSNRLLDRILGWILKCAREHALYAFPKRVEYLELILLGDRGAEV